MQLIAPDNLLLFESNFLSITFYKELLALLFSYVLFLGFSNKKIIAHTYVCICMFGPYYNDLL